MDCPVLLPLVNDVLYQQDQQQHSASQLTQLTQLNNKTGVAIVRDLPPFGGHLLKTSEVSKFIEIALEENILLIGFSICY